MELMPGEWNKEIVEPKEGGAEARPSQAPLL